MAIFIINKFFRYNELRYQKSHISIRSRKRRLATNKLSLNARKLVRYYVESYRQLNNGINTKLDHLIEYEG